ncbi:MAG TPA: AAA family ATPase [Myxococcota bacterium]|nr:AAA family ATPase [Myxococcota bacterium]
MPVQPSVRFGPFELDGRELLLRSPNGPVAVTHKSLLVLQLLLARAGELVSKEELVAAVWPRTAISDAALARRVYELRTALGDDASSPTYIETVHRRGFRFIGPVSFAAPDGLELVGRAAALAQIAAELPAVRRGERRLLLVSGEAGIGKTRLLESLLADPALAGWGVGRGHCIPQGEGQPYLPVLEALGELLEGDASGGFARDLRRLAPSWAAALPELGTAGPAPAGLTQQRMLAELAGALEHAARSRRLVLVFEDLHWADPSTIALFDLLSRRTAPARLLLAGTLRDAALAGDSSELRAFLASRIGRGGCTAIELGRLGEADVHAYLERRFDARIAAALAGSIHARARGLPLFMTWLANDLLDAGKLVCEGGGWRLAEPAERVAEGLPTTLQRLFDVQLAALPRESLAALEAASAIGSSFDAEALAAVLGLGPEEAAAQLRAILGSSFLLARVGAPLERSFALAHELVRDALYARVAPARRRELHAACAKHLAARGGADPAELARHHCAAGDARAAAAEHRAAGQRALTRHALREARAHFEAALALLDEAGEPEGEAMLDLLLVLGETLRATLGDASARGREVYERACRLARSMPDPRRRFEAVYGLRVWHVMRGDLHTAAQLEPELLAGVAQTGDPLLAARAHGQIGERLYFTGDYAAAARELERACTLAEDSAVDPIGRVEVAIVARGTLAHVECLLGRPDTALRNAAAMVEALGERPNPYLLGLARWYRALVHLERREFAAARALSESVQSQAAEHGFADLSSWSESLIGYIESVTTDPESGLAKLERGMAATEAAGTLIGRCTALAGSAAARARLGERAAALALLDQAAELMVQTGELHATATLESTRAEVLAAELPACRDEVYACLRRALAAATAQRGVPWQIRALTGMVQLRAALGGGEAGAAERLRTILSDLREGQQLLDVELARRALESVT